MGRLHTNIQLMVAFFLARVLVSHFFLLYINDLLIEVIRITVIYANSLL